MIGFGGVELGRVVIALSVCVVVGCGGGSDGEPDAGSDAGTDAGMLDGGSDGGENCPRAVISVAEGGQVVPRTMLNLSASLSTSPNGSIAEWEWSVTGPSESVAELSGTDISDPTFGPQVVGNYTFSLRVWDATDVPSCEDATFVVSVVPDHDIHIQLTWDTPSDQNQADEGPLAGSDLDIHFAHPFADGDYDGDSDLVDDPWFDQVFDTFWSNRNPNWGAFPPENDDDPEVARDDTDGAGPEIIEFNMPESVTYKVGVHYWNDHDFGVSTPTVKVYIEGTLAFTGTVPTLNERDMWWVADIAWPAKTVTPITAMGGGDKITADYNHPFFPP